MGDRETEVLRTFVGGLVRGEMEEIDGVIRRIDMPVTPASLKPDVPTTQDEVIAEEQRRLLGSRIYGISGAIVTLALLIIIYTNIFQMKIESAVMAAPTDMLLAPATGDVFFAIEAGRELVQEGEPIIGFVDPKLERDIKLTELKVEESEIAVEGAPDSKEIAEKAMTEAEKLMSDQWLAASAKVRAMENTVRLKREAVDRNRGLLKDGYITKGAFEIIEAEYYKMESQLSDAREDISRLKARVSSAEQAHIIALNEYEVLKGQRKRLILRAPAEGRVLRLFVSKNSSVRYGQQVGIFEYADHKQVSAFLTRDQALSVALGDEVEVYFPAVRKTVDYTVVDIDHVSQAIDERSGNYRWQTDDQEAVTVMLEPADDEEGAEAADILPGMTAIVIFDRRPISRFFSSLIGAF